MQKLVKVNSKNELFVSKKAVQLIEKYKTLKAEFEAQEAELKTQLLAAMQESGTKSFKNDTLRITLVDATTSRSVDTKKLKDAGLYDEYSKVSNKKAYVKIEMGDFADKEPESINIIDFDDITGAF